MRTPTVALVALCAACSAAIGPRASENPVALGPAGAGIEIQLVSHYRSERGAFVSGELLAVSDSGLWVLADRHLARVPFTAIDQAVFPSAGHDDFDGPGLPGKKTLERLRLQSRFPQGIGTELMHRLLMTYGDTAPRTVSFLDAARAATAKYRDVSRALADGYRPVGPGTPAMGRHWVNLGLLIDGKIEAATPAILEYAAEGDSMLLIGVAYAALLGGDEAPPGTPVPASWWHAHRGTLDAEGLNGSHAGMDMGDGDRVAVLHAWVW